MEFIRGKYDVEDVDYIKLQLSNMTSKERKMIETDGFEVLWSKLWGNCKDTGSPEFELARNKFQLLDLKTLLFDSPSALSEPEWGFPKGRRMKVESDIDSALREFFEETNIPKEAFDIRENMSFTETFVGTTKVRYKHLYFVALLKDSKLVNLTQKLTNVQRREISNVAWKTMSECKTITRPHYVERQQMLTELERSVSLPQR
jgi:8-oxo-dGTP pyrophosphatase MutT (NUDIX family)